MFNSSNTNECMTTDRQTEAQSKRCKKLENEQGHRRRVYASVWSNPKVLRTVDKNSIFKFESYSWKISECRHV